MSDDQRAWRAISLVLGGVFVVLLAIAGLSLLPSGSAGPSTPASFPPSAGDFPSESLSPPPSGSTAPSLSPSPASPGASAGPSGSPTASPSASPTPGTATITFEDLGLDATNDQTGLTRTITFRTSGAATVKAVLSTTTGPGKTVMCLGVGSGTPTCRTWTAGTLTGTSSGANLPWTLTLRGNTTTTPVVRLALTFTSSAPSVQLVGGRFDGPGTPARNGLTVDVVPTAAGAARVQADWGGASLGYTLRANDPAGAGSATFDGSGSAVDQSIPVTPDGAWRIALANATDTGPTPLDVTLDWP